MDDVRTETDCRVPGCGTRALSDAPSCWLHLENRPAYLARLAALAGDDADLAGINLAGADLSALDLSNVSGPDRVERARFAGYHETLTHRAKP